MQMHRGWREAVLSAGNKLSKAQYARAEAIHLRYLARRALRLALPPSLARKLAASGFRLAPLAFLGDGYRGPATLVCCFIAPLIPASLRRRIFA